MPDVLDELTGDVLSKHHVEARIKDWENRILALYTQIKTWLPTEWLIDTSRQTNGEHGIFIIQTTANFRVSVSKTALR